MEIDLSGNTAGNEIIFYMCKIETGDIDILNANNSSVSLNACVIHTHELNSSTSSNATPVNIHAGKFDARFLKGVVNTSNSTHLNVTQGSSTSNITIKDSGTTIFGPITFPHAFEVIDGEIEAKVNVMASSNSAQSIPSGASTTVIFEDEDLDNTSSYVKTTGIFTAPVKGIYAVSAQILFNSTSEFDSDEVLYVRLRVNSTIKLNGSKTEAVVTNTQTVQYGSRLSGIVNLEAGDTVDILAFQNSGSSVSLYINNNDNYLHIHKVN